MTSVHKMARVQFVCCLNWYSKIHKSCSKFQRFVSGGFYTSAKCTINITHSHLLSIQAIYSAFFTLSRMPTNWSRTRVHWNVKYDCEWKAVPSVVIEYTPCTKFNCVKWCKLSRWESCGSTELLPQSYEWSCRTLVLYNGSKHEMGILRRSTLL